MDIKIEVPFKGQNKLKKIQSINPQGLNYVRDEIKKLFPRLKVGSGGNHIWISDRNNNRLAIITHNNKWDGTWEE